MTIIRYLAGWGCSRNPPDGEKQGSPEGPPHNPQRAHLTQRVGVFCFEAEFAGLEPKAAADKLVELCKDRKLTIPGDESKGRQTVGPVLQATKNPDGSWNPAQALRDLAKAYPKREEMEAAECACPDNVELLASERGPPAHCAPLTCSQPP